MRYLLLASLALWGCGAEDNGFETSEPPAEVVIEDTPGVPPLNEEEEATVLARLVASFDELPACNPARHGSLVYVEEEKLFYHCSQLEQDWLSLDLKGKDGANGKDGTNGTDGKAGDDGAAGEPGLKISKIYTYQKHSTTLGDALTDDNAFTDRFLVWVTDVRIVYYEDGSFHMTVSGFSWDDEDADNLNSDIYAENWNHTYIGRAKDGDTVFSVKIFDYDGTTLGYAVGPADDPKLSVTKDDDGVISNNDWFIIPIAEED